jgi:hypothetical protein
MTKIHAIALTSLAVLFVAPAARADGLRLEVEAGVRYDSNVSVDATDQTTSIGDVAATFALESGFRLVDEKHTRVEIGYDFSQSLYQDVTSLNYQTHNPELNAWTKLGDIKLGINYGYTNALLDDHFFLEQHSVMPSLAATLSDELLVTLSYRYTDKNFNFDDNGRDARAQQPNVELMYYFDKPKRGYFSLSGGYVTEDAADAEFDYGGMTGRATVQLPFDLAGLESKLKLSYTYQIRDYDDPTSTPSGALREDDRHTLRARGEVELTEELTAIADFRFVDRNSNLVTADYSENIVNGSLRYEF